MIISASRRTDIPAYFSDWFYHRLREGFVLVRNPMNFHQVSRIKISKDTVDGFVFWTKNPIPMITRLDELEGYPYYFQWTLNAYGKDIERNVPSKSEYLIPAFQRLAQKIGKERLVWRYDPIFLNEKYTLDYHYHYFEQLCAKLCTSTDKCIISFIDVYRGTRKRMHPMNIIEPSADMRNEIAGTFARTAKKYGLSVDTCAEEIELAHIGIHHAGCIDKARLEKIGGYALNIRQDRHQRKHCACAESVDIGAYNTCKNACLYCYANFNPSVILQNNSLHHPLSPLLYGEIGECDKIHERITGSNRMV